MVRFVCAANRPEHLPPEFIDRMDFYIYTPLPDPGQRKALIAKIAHGFMKPSVGADAEFLRDYLRWAKTFTPTLTEDARAAAERVMLLVGEANAKAARPRGIEGVLRVALAIARLERKDAGVEHVREAVRLLLPDVKLPVEADRR